MKVQHQEEFVDADEKFKEDDDDRSNEHLIDNAGDLFGRFLGFGDVFGVVSATSFSSRATKV
jgi:hypothetical protein